MQATLWPDEDPVHLSKDLFDKFLVWCADIGANDIYVEAGEVLAVKKDGNVLPVGRRRLRYDELILVLQGIVTPGVDSLLRGGTDIDVNYSVISDDDSRKISFRVNVTPTEPCPGENAGVEVVFRIIPGAPPKWQDLGIDNELLELCRKTQGLVLLIGKTGSGKTTTIASLLRYIIEKMPKHILTFEDPIEYDLKSIPNRIARVVQSEVYRHLKDWVHAVRNSLRRSPDVMLYGELRDKETIKAGLLASETGHLVFATVHANGVETAFDRMVESMSADDARGTTAKLIESTQGLIYQVLVRKRGGGRLALRSYLILDDHMRRVLQVALLKDGVITTVMNDLVRSNGRTIMMDARMKFSQGLITLEEFMLLINQYGTTEDAQLIPDVTSGLLKRGLLDQEEANDWISAFNELEVEDESA